MSESSYTRFTARVASRLRIRNTLIRCGLAECLGTFLLVLFGNGAGAQSMLTKHAFGNIMTVHIASGIALTMAVYSAGGVSGGHVNPAVSLTMSILGRLPWCHLPVYMLGQYIGSFLASAVLYVVYYDALNAYDGGVRAVFGVKGTAGLWATFPAEFVSVGNGLLDQIVGTALLMMCILAIFDPCNMHPSNGLIPIALGALLTVLGMSFGVNFGYALNPARDLAPRIFVAIAGWGMETFSFRNYAFFWIPLLGPHIGAVVGAAIYQLFIGLHFSEPGNKNDADSSCRCNSVKSDEELKGNNLKSTVLNTDF